MKSSAPNDPLERALRELPRQRASRDFTRRVLQGKESRRQSRRPVAQWSLAAAAVALVLLASVLGLRETLRKRSASALARRAEQLRQEHRMLRDELAALRRVVDENPSMIYLGGDENIDLVFDLAPVASRPKAARARPAVLRESEQTSFRRKE